MANLDELFDVFDEQPAFEDEVPANPVVITDEPAKENEDENANDKE